MVIEETASETVIARGTEDGLVLRVDGRNSYERLSSALHLFLSSRKGFLRGSKVISIEWLQEIPALDCRMALIEEIRDLFGLQVKELNVADADNEVPISCVGEALEGESKVIGSDIISQIISDVSQIVEVKTEKVGKEILQKKPTKPTNRLNENKEQHTTASRRHSPLRESVLSAPRSAAPVKGVEAVKEQNNSETQATISYATIRSGQRIQSDHTVVIVGDVNSGAEVIAGGDVIILGNLRGIAHAGAFEEDGGNRMILALGLQQPTQLRIGSYISRGSHDSGGAIQAGEPEVARVVNDGIVVAPYNSKLGGLFQGRQSSVQRTSVSKRNSVDDHAPSSSSGVGLVKRV